MMRGLVFATAVILGVVSSVLILLAGLFAGHAPQIAYFAPADDARAVLILADTRLRQSLPMATYDTVLGSQISWSPDGRWAAFWRYGPANPVVHFHEVDTGRHHIIESETTFTLSAFLLPPVSWSPDGTRAAFMMPTATLPEALHIFDIRTGTVNRLPGAETLILSPLLWHDDGTQIYRYVTLVDNGQQIQQSVGQRGVRTGLIHTFDLNAQRLHTQHINPPCFAAVSWSPDGTRAACMVLQADYSDRPEVVIYQRGESGFQARVMADLPGGIPQNLTWSPDSKQVAYDINRDGNTDVYLLDVERGVEQRITTHPREDVMRTWAPDGQSLVIRSRRGGGANQDLYRYDLVTEQIHALTSDGNGNDTPRYQPTGGLLAYVTNAGNAVNALHLMTADGTTRYQLSNGPSNNTIGLAFSWRP